MQSVTQAYSEIENLSSPHSSQTYDLPITSLDVPVGIFLFSKYACVTS